MSKIDFLYNQHIKSLAYQEKVILLQKISEDIHIQDGKKANSPKLQSIQKFKGIAFDKTWKFDEEDWYQQ